MKQVSAGIVVKANPVVVWDTIRASRKWGHRKVVSCHDNKYIIEEQFQDLPILGKAHCKYVETETPCSRIEYHLLSSDKFKKFEGSWSLRPEGDGSSTYVELSSLTDTGLPVPFARQITDANTLKDINRRLAEVKEAAESAQAEQ